MQPETQESPPSTAQPTPAETGAALNAPQSQGLISHNSGKVEQQYGNQIDTDGGDVVEGDKIAIDNQGNYFAGNITINVNPTQMGESVSRVFSLLVQPDALVHLALFRDRLKNANIQISSLRDCKKLHDCYHSLQIHCLRPILFGVDGFPNDPGFADNLIEYLEDFRSTLRNIHNLTQRVEPGASEIRWIARLDQAQLTLAGAVETLSRTSLNKATSVMRTEIGQNLVRANERLKGAAKGLLDLDLAEMVQRVRDQLASQHKDAATLTQYDEGVKALLAFRDNLRAQVDEHDGWQLAEDTFQLIEHAPIDQLPDAWPELVAYVQPLVTHRTEAWATDMADAMAKLETAVHTSDVARMRPAFRALRSKAINRFFDVDNRLLELCEGLLIFGPRLEGLLSILPPL